MKKGMQYSVLFAIIMALIVLIVVTIILREKVYGLFDIFVKNLGLLK